MSAVLILLGRPLFAYTGQIVFYLAMAILAGSIIRYTDPNDSTLQRAFRVLYPAVMATFFYRMTGGQMFLLFDQFFDWQVVAFEKGLLGVNPTLWIDRRLPNLGLTELLSACYFSYYLLLPGFMIPVFVRGDLGVLREYFAAASITFFVSYSLFWLYPVEGPRWHFSGVYSHSVDGIFFRPIVELVINNAAVHGGAMPSSHTGVALVTLIFCFKYYRRWGWILLPIVAGLAAGTVWGRFHYLSDVIAGAAIGIFAVWLVWKYMKEPDETNRRLAGTER
jgi:membrane-associated phospholipid phosphatase